MTSALVVVDLNIRIAVARMPDQVLQENLSDRDR